MATIRNEARFLELESLLANCLDVANFAMDAYNKIREAIEILEQIKVEVK